MDMRNFAIVLFAAILGAVLLGGGIWIGQASLRSATAGHWQYGEMTRGGMMGGAWMGSSGMMPSIVSSSAEPLSLEDAAHAVEEYLQAVGLSEFEIGEVMIFGNHAYAQVVDELGYGAFEVLVDPVTQFVSLEYGPAMMWNIEFGMMGGRGGMMGGGMMGGTLITASDETISADEAIDLAQNYLDRHLPALNADEHADAFPGYYTIHTQQDGETVGMLSVNAFSGDVWYHSWHGTFIEADGDHD
jgi:hypothetical protein